MFYQIYYQELILIRISIDMLGFMVGMIIAGSRRGYVDRLGIVGLRLIIGWDLPRLGIARQVVLTMRRFLWGVCRWPG